MCLYLRTSRVKLIDKCVFWTVTIIKFIRPRVMIDLREMEGEIELRYERGLEEENRNKCCETRLTSAHSRSSLPVGTRAPD